MPTAVERGFLGFSDIDSLAEQTAAEAAFLEMDHDVRHLSNPDLGATAFDALKVEFAPAFQTVGDYFLKLGGDFNSISSTALKLDGYISNILSPVVTGVSAPSGPQADFLSLDTALATTGADFDTLGSAFESLLNVDDVSSKRFAARFEALGADLLKLQTDTMADKAAVKALSADALNLAGDGSTPLEVAYDTLSLKLHNMARNFGVLSTDIGLLLPAVQTDDAAPGRALGVGLTTINQDVLRLDGNFAGASAAGGQVIFGLLVNAASSVVARFPAAHCSDCVSCCR